MLAPSSAAPAQGPASRAALQAHVEQALDVLRALDPAWTYTIAPVGALPAYRVRPTLPERQVAQRSRAVQMAERWLRRAGLFTWPERGWHGSRYYAQSVLVSRDAAAILQARGLAPIAGGALDQVPSVHLRRLAAGRPDPAVRAELARREAASAFAPPRPWDFCQVLYCRAPRSNVAPWPQYCPRHAQEVQAAVRSRRELCGFCGALLAGAELDAAEAARTDPAQPLWCADCRATDPPSCTEAQPCGLCHVCLGAEFDPIECPF